MSGQTSVYVAAPFERYREARNAAAKLEGHGVRCSSRWIKEADRKLGVDGFTAQEAEIQIAMNDRDVRDSDAVIAIVFERGGREMFAEARYAVTMGIPVFWVLPPGLQGPMSMYRRGTFVCPTVDAAVGEVLGRFTR